MRGNQSNLGEDSYNDDPYGTSNDESYGRQAPEGHQPRNQKPRQQQQRTNGHVNGYQESPRRADDSKKFSRAPPSNRERDQDANKRYTSPPRNNNRQTDQRNARQNERGLNKPTRNNAQQRSPDRQTRFRKENGERPHQQQQNHIGNGASSRRDSDYQDHSPTETRRRQERSPPETHRRQTESPPGNNRRQERSPPRDRRERDQHTDDPMDGQHINDRRVSRDDDDMDHDGNEDDDEYDDDSDGPGEPRAARKGPRIETPEF
ncbi:hypothetical protein FSP39_010345 [Pinctada imbricata]|uniref:Uncharacterized protein n=1 Tax=Pinctada imbricata TaxID=66713 RepID=A0AA88XN76_PINIB|nr:hypothetical protein FSP39_010345 [Pinctada imbricata]